MTTPTLLPPTQGADRHGITLDAPPAPRASSYAERLPGHLLRCTLAGLIGGPLGLALSNAVEPLWSSGPLMIFTAIFALIGALEGQLTTRRPLGAAAGGLIGAAAAGTFMTIADTSGWAFGPLLVPLGALAAIAAALSSPAASALRPLRAFCVGLSTMLGVLVAYTLFIDPAAPTLLASPVVAEAGFGASLGFFFALGGVAAVSVASFDEVARRWQRVGRALHGEPADLARRAVRLRRDIMTLAATPEVQSTSDDPWLGEILTIANKTTLHVIDVAAHLCATVAPEASDGHRVRARLYDLDQRIDRTTDHLARVEYEAAADSLRRQLRRHHQLSGERERLVARLHRGLSALERLRLIVVEKGQEGGAPRGLPSMGERVMVAPERTRQVEPARALLR